MQPDWCERSRKIPPLRTLLHDLDLERHSCIPQLILSAILDALDLFDSQPRELEPNSVQKTRHEIVSNTVEEMNIEIFGEAQVGQVCPMQGGTTDENGTWE